MNNASAATTKPRRRRWRVVIGVVGFLFMRPRGRTEGTPEDQDRYGTEEPTGFGWFSDSDQLEGESLRSAYVQPLYGVYRYVEFEKPGAPGVFVRVERSSEANIKKYPHGVGSNWRSRTSGIIRVPYVTQRVNVNESLSRYAYVWRGLRRPRDRDFGIAGGEFFLVDRATNEVLGMKRTFNSTFVPTRPRFTRWSAARACRGSAERQPPPMPMFAIKVLMPNLSVNDDFLPDSEVPNFENDLRTLIETDHAH